MLRNSQKFFLVCFIICLCLTTTMFAKQWEVTIQDNQFLPSGLVVVDKAAKKFEFLAKKSPLKIEDSYKCITGEKAGDKLVEGDLKTPEGIYFVTGKINGGLDFDKYGGIAYPISYPNPVDKIKKKTGSGIWIHSKGKGIEGQATEGCIAIDLDKIAVVGNKLKPHTPVLIAENVQKVSTDASNNKISAVANKTENWNKAWASRSKEMFDFYDPKKYSIANEDFQSFVKQKESIFDRVNWIDILYDEVNVLEGPDYWVSWFEQFYVAPNLRTKGIRRLYWQEDSAGEMKIVGMEWLPQDDNVHGEYLAKISSNVNTFIDSWKKSWLNADINNYKKFYKNDAIQDNRQGSSIFSQKSEIWAKKKPVKLEFSQINIRSTSEGIIVEMIQDYQDSSGYKDKGKKELLLYPDNNNSYKIVKENWKKIG